MVDRAIAKIHGGDNSITQTSTLLQLMPANCYTDDKFMGFVYPYIVPIAMTLSWLFAVAHCIKTLTAYRETGLEEVCICFSGCCLHTTRILVGFLIFSITESVFITNL